MKHEAIELIFALQVRDLAIRMRHEEFGQECDSWLHAAPDESAMLALNARKVEWHAAHPLMEYVPKAFAAAVEAADIIAGLKSEQA